MESRLSLMRGRVLHLSLQEAVREHRTPAYKLLIGIDADLAFTWTGRKGTLRAVLVAPNVAQQVEAKGLAVGMFCEAGSALAPHRALSAPYVAIAGKLCDALVAVAWECARGAGCADGELSAEAFRHLRLASPQRLDARVQHSLGRLKRTPDVPLHTLASDARVSAERLRHLIAEQTCLPLSEHRLLQRTTLAIEHMLRGVPVARSAAAAGFADHAHFTRSFGRMFGRAPSSMPARSLLHASWAERAEQG